MFIDFYNRGLNKYHQHGRENKLFTIAEALKN